MRRAFHRSWSRAGAGAEAIASEDRDENQGKIFFVQLFELIPAGQRLGHYRSRRPLARVPGYFLLVMRILVP